MTIVCRRGIWLSLLYLLAPAAHAAAEDQWAATLARAAESVVSLQLAQLRNFDDADQGGSNATGFVVDAKRGIVLTNRHVVGSGPIRLSATFQNQERVDAVPLYRDPVHDFAFLQYDPADLKYARPATLTLRPDKVSTGLDIRVIGSDGGEQLSILTGTIARLDRHVPSYGRYGYNDFNTFYLQAASSTSGGSSGSPVIDFDGDVVALNAAANTKTASSFFLPLPRIQHALNKLQTGEPITRGGLQTLFRHQPFRELNRLGLDEPTEKRVRKHDTKNNGMLTVRQVIAGGVADELLQEGDILVGIDEKIITSFIALEDLLDKSIGSTLSVAVVRHGEALTLSIKAADLHAIQPDRFVELGDSILQNMSIQHARAMNRPQQGVVVTRPGYYFTSAGIAQSSVITELNGSQVNNLDDLLKAIRASARDRKVQARYVVPGREFTSEIAQIDIGNRWFGHRECQRVDAVRFWNCHSIDLPRKQAKDADQQPQVPRFKDALLNKVAPAMVHVDFSIPYAADNIYARHFKGVGIVIDKQQGLVAVDRNTVPIGVGDAEITFFGSLLLEGSVVFLHPRHNIALLQYDPAQLQGADFDELKLVEDSNSMPELLTMVGYRADGTFRRHQIDSFSRVTVGFPAPGLARFQQSALDVYSIANVPPSLGGPFVDENGDVHALYMSFAYEEGREIRQREWAMPASVILEALRMYQTSSPYYSLDAQLAYKSIAQARQLNLPDAWLVRYNKLDASLRRVLYIEQIVPSTDASEQLMTGDIVLAFDNVLVANLFTAELLSQKPDVMLTVLRSGEVIEVNLKPSELNGLGTQRLISWGGALFQEPHSEIGYLKGVDFPGVYIAHTEEGSPAQWDGLYRNRFVTEVDGVPVENLDDFLGQISSKEQDEVTRLSLVSMSGRKRIVTLLPEYNFWPTFEVKRTKEGWQRINYLN